MGHLIEETIDPDLMLHLAVFTATPGCAHATFEPMPCALYGATFRASVRQHDHGPYPRGNNLMSTSNCQVCGQGMLTCRCGGDPHAAGWTKDTRCDGTALVGVVDDERVEKRCVLFADHAGFHAWREDASVHGRHPELYLWNTDELPLVFHYRPGPGAPAGILETDAVVTDDDARRIKEAFDWSGEMLGPRQDAFVDALTERLRNGPPFSEGDDKVVYDLGLVLGLGEMRRG